MSTVSGGCPTNEASWMQRSTKFCNNSQEYHCLPTLFLNESVEICLTVKLLQQGYCVIYNPYLTEASIDSISSCVRKTNFSGCPTKSYYSNEIYHHPSCQKINPVKQCYLADSSCPNITIGKYIKEIDIFPCLNTLRNMRPSLSGVLNTRSIIIISAYALMSGANRCLNWNSFVFYAAYHSVTIKTDLWRGKKKENVQVTTCLTLFRESICCKL